VVDFVCSFCVLEYRGDTSLWVCVFFWFSRFDSFRFVCDARYDAKMTSGIFSDVHTIHHDRVYRLHTDPATVAVLTLFVLCVCVCDAHYDAMTTLGIFSNDLFFALSDPQDPLFLMGQSRSCSMSSEMYPRNVRLATSFISQ